MGIELLVEPGRSTFMDSNTQKIGLCTVGTGAVPLLMLVVTGATVEWPSPSQYLNYVSFGIEKVRTSAASANPVTPEEEIDAVVEQVPEE